MKNVTRLLLVTGIAVGLLQSSPSAWAQASSNKFAEITVNCFKAIINPIGTLASFCTAPSVAKKPGNQICKPSFNGVTADMSTCFTINGNNNNVTVVNTAGNKNKVNVNSANKSGKGTSSSGKSAGGSKYKPSGNTAQNEGSSYYEYEDQSGTKIKAKGKAAEYAAQSNTPSSGNGADPKSKDVVSQKPSGQPTANLDESKIPEGATVTVGPDGKKSYSYVKASETPKPEVYNGVESNYVKKYNETLTSDQQKNNENVATKQAAYNADDSRENKKALKTAEKDNKKLNGQMEILQENRGGYGGQYGGAKVEVTDTVNMGVKTLSTIASQVATNSATNQNNNVMYGIQQQGSAATQKAINNSQADMMENSAKANSKLGMATVVMSAIQGERIYAHLNSRKKVNEAYKIGTDKAKQAMAAAQKDYDDKIGGCQAMTNPEFRIRCMNEENAKLDKAKDLYAYQKDNANNNVNGELDAQNSTATKQTIETATTAAQAAYMLAQANSLKKAANAIRNQPTADAGSGFSFNPGGVTAAPTPDANAVTADPGTVVADDSVVPTDMGNTDLLNPNIADAGPGGPAAGQFQAGNPAAGAGGGGMGMGSVGGTSAAKDDSVKPETAAMKAESGKYAAGEGTGGSRFSRGGGGGTAVGLDSGIGDLLKKFLPGGEEDKKKDGDLAFDSDRSPASDQAAVLGRNQNIFEAIHKRYQKKHNEGAIVFVGDRG